MLRQIVARPLLVANRAAPVRYFSSGVPRLAEGDTGSPRPHGYVGIIHSFIHSLPIKDWLRLTCWWKKKKKKKKKHQQWPIHQAWGYCREYLYQGTGNGKVFYIPRPPLSTRTKEKSSANACISRLRALKKKLGEQRKHLDELDKHMYFPLPLSIPKKNPRAVWLTCLFSDELTKENKS